MGASRVQIFAIWLLTTLLVALFVLVGGGKLAATGEAVAHFKRFGYPHWFMLFVGGVELAAGLCLLFPRTALVGAVALLPIMGGAAWTHWCLGESVLVPVIVWGMLAVLAWLRWTTRVAHRPPVPSGGAGR